MTAGKDGFQRCGDDLIEEVKRLEAELDDLKKRWPAHSVKPRMVAELERLEEELEEAKGRLAAEGC